MAFIYSLTDTWNDGAVTFTGIGLNVTDSASNAASNLLNLQVGGTSRFSVDKNGLASAGGFSGAGGGNVNLIAGGVRQAFVASSGFILRSTAPTIAFGSDGNGANSDLFVTRDAANTLGQRNGTAAQALRVYNTFTDASNYERGVLAWVGNDLKIGTENAGTGVSNRQTHIYGGGQIRFFVGAVQRWVVDASGHFVAGADNLYDIGASGASRPRDVWVAGQVYAGNGVRADGANGLQALSGPISAIGANSRVELAEVGAPAAPSANRVRIYAEDNGSGKTRLMALFATGAAVQIAIEP